MKVLLDENFPLRLSTRLREAGVDAEHIIELGQRGLPDSAIRERLAAEALVFLTQDTEFESIPATYQARVIISRVPQRLATAQRVEIWLHALQTFLEDMPTGPLFELTPDGAFAPLNIRPPK